MPTYSSNEAFFEAVRRVVDRMNQCGQGNAAKEIQSGLSALNGLTDGWALLMESIEKTLTTYGRQLPSDLNSELEGLLTTVKNLVYR